MTGNGVLKYRLLDHTADFGVLIFGPDVRRLFENAGYVLFELITDVGKIEAAVDKEIRVSGDDWADLMVNWLRELLCLWAVDDILIGSVAIESITEYNLKATLKGVPFDPGRHIIRTEIKAVTYHQIDVRPEASGWSARVIFDV